MESRFLVKAYIVALLILAVIFFLISCSQSGGQEQGDTQLKNTRAGNDSDFDKLPPFSMNNTTPASEEVGIDISKIKDPYDTQQKETLTEKIGNAFASVTGLIPLRYESEQVGNRLIRYDRFTSRVEWKSVFSKDNKWRPLKFKNLQQAKAVFQRQDLENAAKDALENNKNDSVNDDYQKRLKEIHDDYQKSMNEIRQQDMEYQMERQQDEIDRLKRKSEYGY